MAIDWEKFQGELDDLITGAGKRTDDKLAGKISSITRMTDDEVKNLFPEPADVKKLADLMEIVQGADEQNQKINAIVSNAEKFGGIILTLLGKFA